MKTLLLTLLSIGGLLAQSTPPNQLQIYSPAPSPVRQIGGGTVGQSGSTTLYYWVIARYSSGIAVNTTPVAIFNTVGTANLTASNYVAISWAAVGGATGYDVLRSTTPIYPSNPTCTGCAVVLNTPNASVNDTGAALSNYPPAGLVQASSVTATLYLDNGNSVPYFNVQLLYRATENLIMGLVSGPIADGDCIEYSAGRLVSAGAACGSGSGGTPGGAPNDIQVNDSGAFGGGRCTMDSSQNLTCTGTVAAPILSATGATAGEVSTYELALNGSEYISWLAPDSITTTYRLMFPTAVPSAGQVLTFSAPSGGIATGTWSTPSSTISTPFFLPFGPMAVGGGTLTATIGSANRVYHIAANAPAALSVSNVNLGTSNFGNLAVAFYDSSCTLIGQTATTATSATGVTVAVNSAPITIPAGKFYVSWTGDATASAIYGTSAGYVPDMWNAGATPEYFYGSNASTGTTTLTFPGTCGTRTAVANGANPQPPGIILR